MRVVLDTCILKLATFPAEHNASALIFELARAGLIEAWVSPAILEEYADVLGDQPAFVADVVEFRARIVREYEHAPELHRPPGEIFAGVAHLRHRGESARRIVNRL